MMSDSNLDLREILQSSERPRALTEAEERRMLARLAAADEFVASPRPVVSHGAFEAVDLELDAGDVRSRPRVGSWPIWIAGAAAAVALLFVGLSVREPAQPQTAQPLDTAQTITLPGPDEPAKFCSDHVDAISNALERWRGLENWAFSGGTPDIGQLADEALLAAAEFDHTVDTDRATDARDRLRAALDQIDATASGRNAIAPRVSAIDDALETIGDISSDVTPPCDLTELNAARDLG